MAPSKHSEDEGLLLSDYAPERRSMSATTPHFATTTVAIEGMTCGACTSAVEAAFKDVAGIGSVSISLLAERAVVMHDPESVSAEKIAEL